MSPFNPWKLITSWFGKEPSPAAQGCDVYIRPDGTWIFPLNAFDGLSFMDSPFAHLPPDASPQDLGAQIIRTLAASGIPKPALPRNHASPAQQAGFKSLTDLQLGAVFFLVLAVPEGVSIVPFSADDAGQYVLATKDKITCALEPIAIGQAIAGALPLCIPRPAPPPIHNGNISDPADRTPDPKDLPVSFGYKTTWLALPTSNGPAVAAALGLTQTSFCAWDDGIHQVYNSNAIFITPPISGWTLVIGHLPEPGPQGAQFLAMLKKLSTRFGKAYYFGTHRVSDYHAWAIADNGKIIRAFGFCGDTLINQGGITPDENELNIGTPDSDNPPDEEHVLQLASRWVLDPRELDQRLDATGPGWLSKTPPPPHL